ncbi:hypothetical protein TRFO_03662 [Tritrichomonas foetus]|uniref:Uncharacterized protein n=1 Tax=Tritrichomonas foetus TaxID=1144522 RepID=A0A1J4KNX3_9EUKA|nr:hypothetical protein TRFO_03662 [Tritrichomonas foetus]|eukprot:OHT12624.1 hypothetical protein TRFO_03662 [Tritrichomonas foetus]
MSLHYTKSGALDMRYSSSRAAVASGNYGMGYGGFSPSPLSSMNYNNIHTKIDGTLDMRYSSSKAIVASQQIYNQPSFQSPTSSPYKNQIHLKKDGTPDMRYKASQALASNSPPQPKTADYSDIRTSDIRDPYQQKKYRAESKSKYKDEKEACHIVDLQVALKCIENRPGEKLSKQQLKEEMKPINELLRMRLKETNRGYDKDMADRICDLLDNKDNRVTRGVQNKIEQMVEAMNSIPANERNNTTDWVSQRLTQLKEKHCV